MKSIKMIEEFSNANGVSGFEDEVIQIARRYASHLANTSEDSLRNLYLHRKANKGKRPVVMLDAHSDEIGFMVQAIRPNGTLQFIPLGGWVESTIPAQKVKIRNENGEYVSGVVASKPPHFMTEAERNQKLQISNMVIDIGSCSKEETENVFKIRVGAPVIPDAKFHYFENNEMMLGKAFDCRIGCAAVIDTLECIQDLDLKVDVVGTITSQEEVGTRGAQVAAQTIKPDVAILFEGAPADDTFSESFMIQAGIKKGPMLRHIDKRMITNPKFMKFTLDISKKYDIQVQEAVRTGGGTNGGAIHLANNGIPVIVISIPVRYAHTHYGYASLSDYKNAIALASLMIKELNKEIIKTF